MATLQLPENPLSDTAVTEYIRGSQRAALTRSISLRLARFESTVLAGWDARASLRGYSCKALRTILTLLHAHPLGLVPEHIANLLVAGADEQRFADIGTYLPDLVWDKLECLNSLPRYRMMSWFPSNERKARESILVLMASERLLINAFTVTNKAQRHELLGNPLLGRASKHYRNEQYWHLTDERLLRLLFEHPDDRMRTYDFVCKRNCIDYDLIDALITDCEPALTGGVL